MENYMKCIIGIVLIIAILFVIGTLWTSMEVNTNIERVNNTAKCSVELPKDVQFEETRNNNTTYTGVLLTSSLNSSWGRVVIDYESDDSGVWVNGTNSTEPYHNPQTGAYEWTVYNNVKHQKLQVRADNPAICEKIGKSVKFV